jgi:NADPH-dependent 2,4-dienoyl-CoA reductase/sulfur reductase-like enzyme
MNYRYRYLIIGGGLAGASAIAGIRQQDKEGTIGLLCAETILPYHRPPLSKDLLWGKKTFPEIFVFDEKYYADQKVTVHLRTRAKSIHPVKCFAADEAGNEYYYSKLLIATGGNPRQFSQAGEAVHYFRNARDYEILMQAVPRVKDFLIVGGGFIGAELAAGLIHLDRKVMMLFTGKGLLDHIFPADLSASVTDFYKQKGVYFFTEDDPAGFEPNNDRVKVTTKGGKKLETGWVIAGIGIDPEAELAQSAGLQIDKGIVVDKNLRTSRPGIYAAGDLARFPCEALGQAMRLEHWDNAGAQGKCAGINMAGGSEPYGYLPYFYSDLFEMGFEAVGLLDAKMKTVSAWEIPFRKGVVVYLEDDQVKGVLLWQQTKMLDWARKLILDKAAVKSAEDLKVLIPAGLAV